MFGDWPLRPQYRAAFLKLYREGEQILQLLLCTGSNHRLLECVRYLTQHKSTYGEPFPVSFNLTSLVSTYFTFHAAFLYRENHHLHRIFTFPFQINEHSSIRVLKQLGVENIHFDTTHIFPSLVRTNGSIILFLLKGALSRQFCYVLVKTAQIFDKEPCSYNTGKKILKFSCRKNKL